MRGMAMGAGRLLVGLGLAAALGCIHHDRDRDGTVFLGPEPETVAVAVADLDWDGRLDVASLVRNPDGTGVLVLRTQHMGGYVPGSTFDAPQRAATGPDPRALLAADLDGDGHPELLVVDGEPFAPGQYGVTIRFFTPPWLMMPVKAPLRLGCGTRRPLQMAVGDLNGDGRPDIALAAEGGKDVLVAYGNGDGTFKPFTGLDVGGTPQAVAIGALQAGQRPSLAVATDLKEVRLLIPGGIVPGGLVPGPTLTVGTRPRALALADLDGDGLSDLVVACAGDSTRGERGSVWVALQNGLLAGPASLGFLPPKAFDTGDDETSALLAADLDGDGKPEVVTANAGRSGDPGSESVFRLDSTRKALLAPDLYQGYWGPVGLAFGDLDGDGLKDLVIADGETRIRIQDRGHPGTFLPPVVLAR
jgi:hypothetical protein